MSISFWSRQKTSINHPYSHQIQEDFKKKIRSIKENKRAEETRKVVHDSLLKMKNEFDEKYLFQKGSFSKKRQSALKKITSNFASQEFKDVFNNNGQNSQETIEDSIGKCTISTGTIANFLKKNFINNDSINFVGKTHDYIAVYLNYKGFNHAKITIEKKRKTNSFFATYGISILIIAILLFGYYSFPSLMNDYTNKETPIPKSKERKIQAFSTPSPKDSLRVLITRFGSDNTFGEAIKNRIHEVAERDSLPIKAIYLKSILSPNSIKGETKPIIKKYNVDLLLYGKISEFNATIQKAKGYLKYEVSDTLHNLLSAYEKEKLKERRGAKINNIIETIEEQKEVIYNESFDAWLKGVASYKLGKQNDEFFYINPDLSPKERAKKLYDRATLIKGYYTKQAYNDLIEAAELDTINLAVNQDLCKRFIFQNKKGIKYCDRLVKLQPTAENYIARGVYQRFNSSSDKNGIVYFEDNYKENVLSNFHKALELDPNNPKIYLCAIKYLSSGSIYAGFAEDIRDDATMMAGIYVNKGLRLAKKQFDRSLTSRKILAELYDARAYYNSFIAYKQQDTITAISDLLNAIKFDPQNNRYKKNLLRIYKKQKKNNRVIGLYNSMIRSEPLNIKLYKEKAIFFKNLKSKDSIIETYKKAVALKLEEGHYLLGVSYLEFKDSIHDLLALKNFNEAIKKDSSKPYYYTKRIEVYERLKRLKKKEREEINCLIFKDYKKKFLLQNYKGLHHNINFYRFSQNYDEAINICEEAILKHPFNYEGYNCKIKFHEQKKEYSKAINVCKQALELQINDVFFYEKIIKLCLKNKDTLKGQKYYKDFIKLDMKNNHQALINLF